MTYHKFFARTALSGLFTTLAFGAVAQEADFFKGKTLSINIGYEAGSTYDLYARLLADHIGRFLPGKPNIIARNMPGAGSLRVASFIYKAAPKDGTAWGSISRDVATEPLLYGAKSKAAFKDPLEFNWIGSLNTEVGVMAVWHTTGVKTWAEASKKPIIAAMSSSQGGIATRAVNSLLHANIQQVCCYGGGNLQNFAMERGEVEARIGWSWSSLKATKMDWLESGKINLLMQIGLKKNPDIPGSVPLVLDLAPTEKDKKALRIIFSNQSMGRPYMMPPGVPPARVATIREAFMTMVKDKAFLSDAEKKKLEINDPQSGKAVEDLLREVYASPKDAVAAARHAITSGKIKMVREPKKKKKKKKE